MEGKLLKHYLVIVALGFRREPVPVAVDAAKIAVRVPRGGELAALEADGLQREYLLRGPDIVERHSEIVHQGIAVEDSAAKVGEQHRQPCKRIQQVCRDSLHRSVIDSPANPPQAPAVQGVDHFLHLGIAWPYDEGVNPQEILHRLSSDGIAPHYPAGRVYEPRPQAGVAFGAAAVHEGIGSRRLIF